MKNRLRLYIDTQGSDDSAVTRIIREAIIIENKNPNVSRIVFVARGLQNDGWLERQYGRDGVKRLQKGAKLPNSKVGAKFESLKTYNTVEDEIVITLGLKSDDILLLEDSYDNITAIIALPWLQNDVEKWAKIGNATEIISNSQIQQYNEPDCVVRKALEDLTSYVNMTTGISQSDDNRTAKTYLRALKKHGFNLNEEEIESYLIKNLDWQKDHSDELLEIVNRLNTGRTFQGGEKTGLKNYIKGWEEECK